MANGEAAMESAAANGRRSARPKKRIATAANFGLLAGSLLIVALASELGLRLFCNRLLGQTEDERTLTYRYDPQLGWFPIPNSGKQFTGHRTIHIRHNSRGFRDREPAANGRPGVIFLGDSLVWGFDVEAEERFTERLQALHPNWAVSNLGVSGYGTDQEYLLLQRWFDQYKPAVVFLLICGDNDNEDNAWNFRGGYYKPYYTIAGGGLKLNGVPVPKSEKVVLAEHTVLTRLYLSRLITRVACRWSNPKPVKSQEPPTGALLLDMRGYVTGKGAYFAVGLQHSSPELEQFLHRFEIPFADLDTTNAAHYYPTHGNHWTPEGQAFVAGKIDEFLQKK
jgi:hypothetical protein